jgi:hypothetical protein
MKNIHILPTDKPSRLRYFDSKLEIMSLIPKKSDIVFQNIYITSDEEIKDGDWIIYKNKVSKIERGDNELFHLSKKIILTTDQDLIKDGIQAISDEFIELFVKNLNCERVEVKQVKTFNGFLDPEYGSPKYKFNYHIIIPKEEPKQTDENGKPLTYWGGLEEPIQETIEEAADSYSSNPIFRIGTPRQDIKRGFELGAKWQAERMYSEEDMTNYAMFILLNKLITPKEWFEQFKKK